MRNLFWALVAAMMLIACDPIEDKKDADVFEDACEVCGKEPCVCEDETCPDCGKNPCECTEPNPEFTPLQPSEQKAKISSVGEKLLEKLPAEEWEKYAQFAEDLANSCYFSEDYDWGNTEEWLGNHVDGTIKEVENETDNDKGYSFERVTDLVILMADHTGLFTFTEKGVTVSDYNGGTKAVFTLNGKKYVAEIKGSGKVTKVKMVAEDYEWWYSYDYYYDEEKDEWIEEQGKKNEYNDKIIFTVGVPEQIDITLTENGSSFFSATMKFQPSFKKENMELTTDALTVKATVSINGFEIVADRVAYDGAAGTAAFKTSLKKNGESLFSTSASADLKLKTETYTYGDETYGGTSQYVVAEKAKNINMSMDIIGEIQVKGSCSNAMEAAEELELIWEALSYYNHETGGEKTPNLIEANRHVDNFNAKFKINVYYDGKDTKQAAVKFAIAETEVYYGRTYYDVIPIIEFNDGSKYKIEEFFTEHAFGDLIDSFYELCESYDEVFGFTMEM